MFDHRCLYSISRISWHERVNNDKLFNRLFGNECQGHPLLQALKLHRFTCLSHVLEMLPHHSLFAYSASDWRRMQGK